MFFTLFELLISIRVGAFAMVVIIFGLDCFINSVLVYFHFPQIHCLIISLDW